MALKKKYDKQSDIPKGLEAAYVERDGVWVRDDEDGDEAPDKSKLAELRNNNLELQRQLRETQGQLGQFKGLDPTKANEALATLRAMQEDQELHALLGDKPDAARVRQAAEKLAQARAKALIEERDSQIRAVTEAKANVERDYQSLSGRYARTALSTGLSEELSAAGWKLAKGAAQLLPDIAGKDWEVAPDGALTSRGIFDKDGKPLTTLKDYVPHLRATFPLLFEAPAGGGANPGNGGPGNTGVKGVAADPLVPGGLVFTEKTGGK